MDDFDEQAVEILACSNVAWATTCSGAILAAISCWASPGSSVALPAWLCSSVGNALAVGGYRPWLIDVTDAMTVDLAFAKRFVPVDLAAVVYAPFGGNASDFEDLSRWCISRGIPLLVDLTTVADLPLARALLESHMGVASFRPGKPWGADGGAIVCGRESSEFERIATFLRGGKDAKGRKVGVGIELPMSSNQRKSAIGALRHVEDQQGKWHASTLEALDFPGILPGWARCPWALSKVPILNGPGKPLNPDATHRVLPWSSRVKALDNSSAPSGTLKQFEQMYDNLRTLKVRPGKVVLD